MTKGTSNRIESITTDLYDDCFIQELENRLETDPLFPGGLVELIDETICTHGCGTNTCAPNECGTNYCNTNECRPNACVTNGSFPPPPPVEGFKPIA